MLSLEKNVGLPIELNDDFTLTFGEGVAADGPQIREFITMKSFLKDPFAAYPRREVYRAYRSVGRLSDSERTKAAGLEFGLVVLPPGKMGEEFAKTAGHYYSRKAGTDLCYPAVWEVVSGKVFWLLQSLSPNRERVAEVYWMDAARGEKIIVPPGFGITTVNPGAEPVIVAFWQRRGVLELAEPYEAHNGAAYYVLEVKRLQKSGMTSPHPELVPNLHYESVPPARRIRSRELPQFGLRTALPMYFTAARDLRTLDFLTNPENYDEELIPERLFSELVYEKL